MANLYSISYNTNNSTGGTTPATQTAESNATTYTFAAPLQNDLTKTGYLFVGWSENPSATNPQYEPGATITLGKASPSITLYAVWQSWSTLKMQQMTPSACAQLDEAGRQLTDSRDNKKYWVAKLRDGNCWMTQNLDLDLNGRTLSPSDSDVSSSWTSTTGASALWSTTGNNDIKYYDPGLKYCNTSNCNATTSSNNGHDAEGNYYTFNAATAGTGQSYTTSGQNAPSSICPKGWMLPRGDNTANSSGNFRTLTNTYGITSGTDNGSSDTNLLNAPLYFVRGGYVHSGSLNTAGSDGRYWSSTAYSSTNAYYLRFNSSSVIPSNNNHRYSGLSVRCVAR